MTCYEPISYILPCLYVVPGGFQYNNDLSAVFEPQRSGGFGTGKPRQKGGLNTVLHQVNTPLRSKYAFKIHHMLC